MPKFAWVFLLAAWTITGAGCAALSPPRPRPVVVTCPPPNPVPETLSPRPESSMQRELQELYRCLLSGAPCEQTSSPPRSGDSSTPGLF